MASPDHKKINWFQFVLFNLLVLLLLLLPFFPGPPNKIALYLSFIINAIGFIGLIVVPVGLYQLFNYFRKRKSNAEARFPIVGLYFISIPVLVLVTRLYIMDPLSDYSRNVAIESGQQLVTAIEDFKIKQGRYPASINELNIKLPAPKIMGIDKFRYTKYGDDFFVAFSQWPDGGITEEIVLFGKISPSKNLVSREEYNYNNDFHRAMGAFTSHETGYTNWTSYLCD